MSTTTTAWFAKLGIGQGASKSAAFGPPTPLKRADSCSSSYFGRDKDIYTIGRTSSQQRSKSADSEKTLVDEPEVAESRSGKAAAVAVPRHLHPSGDAPLSVDLAPAIDGSSRGIVGAPQNWRMTDRELYHRLQNLAKFPNTLPLARRRLLAEMSHLLQAELGPSKLPADSSIFSLPTRFDDQLLSDWLQQQHDATVRRFAQYSRRRNDAFDSALREDPGMPRKQAKKAGREMFVEGEEQCKRWLRRASVVKYVDGSWLAHLLRVTTGINPLGDEGQRGASLDLEHQRRAARASWQVMSEELGDGDLARSHVAIYEALMDSLQPHDAGPAPKGEDRHFTEWAGAGDAVSEAPGTDTSGNDRCWRAAIVQLCLSVSPNEFLPEALGFNMAYESLPYHLLVSSREIEELLGRDVAYYFWLHVSIDNADSGHSAMARLAVIDYLRAAEQRGGPALANELWARVKLGYALANGVPTTPLLDGDGEDDTPTHLRSTAITSGDQDGLCLDASESDVQNAKAAQRYRCQILAMLRAKAVTASGMHASVRAQLSGRSLTEWLDPAHIETRAPELLDALASNPVWIKRGDPAASRFVREFEWGGKMFGALTSTEVEALRLWVALLKPMRQDESDDDAKIERLDRETVADFLASHSGTVSADLFFRLAPANDLRPFPVDDICSWRHLGTKLYARLMSRADAPRGPMPHHDTVIDELAKLACPLPDRLSEQQLWALMPTLLVITAPLEQVISASCGRLASPLGMACVKVLRVLLGFTEYALPSSQGDGREVGCMGTDDIKDESEGVWEMMQCMYTTLARRRHPSARRLSAGHKTVALAAADLEPDAKTPAVNSACGQACSFFSAPAEHDGPDAAHEIVCDEATSHIGHAVGLDQLCDRPADQLALPALVLQLSGDAWGNMPVLLGIMLILVRSMAHHPSVIGRLDEQRSKRTAALTDRAAAWLEWAVRLGGDTSGTMPRGVPHCDWEAQVERGKRVAMGGVRVALQSIGSSNGDENSPEAARCHPGLAQSPKP